MIQWHQSNLLAKDAHVSPSAISRFLIAALIVSLAGTVAAQTSVPPFQESHFADTVLLKPPPGVKLAIIEWEDPECPYCGHAFPLVHQASDHYHIPLIRHDFNMPYHHWSRQASINARYLQEKVSPAVANEYRGELFAAQTKIATTDDLHRFTQQFFTAHGKQLPADIDPTGQLAKQVDAETQLGLKMNPHMYTPTIIVTTPWHWFEVKDVNYLNQAIDQAEALVKKHEAPHPATK
jgi:protein-disulfide isomerase